jgi:hypothetical protein
MAWVDRHWGWCFGLMIVSTVLVVAQRVLGI